MSLVIASNQDNEYIRDEQSIFTAWSFRNALSSTYKIPPNSQVCLQSAKVNLDGRMTIEQSNSVYYDWFGMELDPESVGETQHAIDFSTSYPIKQEFVDKGLVGEFTTPELAQQIKDKHREYHPNRMGHHDVQRRTGTFSGFDFKYGFDSDQSASSKPTTTTPWSSGESANNGSYSYNTGTGVFQRINVSGNYYNTVAILQGHPLSVSNGSMRVTFQTANASGVEWGIGLSRDCPNTFVNSDTGFDFKPVYFTHEYEIADSSMDLDGQNYYLDFGVHRNASGELVVRQSSWDTDTQQMMFSEVKYWTNASSDLSGASRYDISKNTGGYHWAEFRVEGEKVNLYIGHSGSTDLVCQVDAVSPKDSMFKPISQTCWCLHPVLYVGSTPTATTNQLTLDTFSGLNIAGYSSDTSGAKYQGWFERLSLDGYFGVPAEGHCKVVDSRFMNQPENASFYDYIGLNASNINDYSPAMITAPNTVYFPSYNAATAQLFGFPNKSLVNVGTYSASGTIVTLTLTSDITPTITNQKSIFVRLNNFGQQVLNARTGNQSTILSHLPTAEVKDADIFFYEPNRDVWLDLNNPYEITTSDISIDFVYSNEQYAKTLQGQSIVVLYFRTPK